MSRLEIIVVAGQPNEQEKSCADCFYNRAAVSWWCTNPEAIEYRKTSIPNIKNCAFWKPARMESDLNWKERLFGDFLKVDLTADSTKS